MIIKTKKYFELQQAKELHKLRHDIVCAVLSSGKSAKEANQIAYEIYPENKSKS